MGMMTALTSAVSGMTTEQTALDAISNNIANVNTIGYKSQTVSFSDLLSQTIQEASASTSTTGSTNPQQIGLGTKVSSTTTDTSVGSTESTSSGLDVALGDSNSYLVVKSDTGSLEYTRDGEISIDDDGYLSIDGYEVCGWTNYSTDSSGNKVYDTTTTPAAINVYSDSTGDKTLYKASETTEAAITGHLSSSDSAQGTSLTSIGTSYTPSTSTTVKVFDSEGNETDATLSFTKCAASQNGITSWYWQTSASDTSITPSSGYIAFDSSGNIVTDPTILTAAVSTPSSSTTASGYKTSNVSVSSTVPAGSYDVSVTLDSTTGDYTVTLDTTGFSQSVTTTNGAAVFTLASGETITLSSASLNSGGDSTITVAGTTESFPDKLNLQVSSSKTGTGAVSVALNLAGLASSSASNSLSCDADGNAAGTASGSYSINKDGTIAVTYTLTDGTSVSSTVGQIALATFRNAAGLEKEGDNLYTKSSSSGDPTYVAAGSGGTSTLSTSALELSNVDLATQFSDMMISQRAYQANSKVISTADTMLQSLINMVG